MFCHRVDILNILFDLLSLDQYLDIYVLSSVDSAVGLDLFKTVVASFKYPTRTMMPPGFWNSRRMYYFRFSLNLLYWSLDYLCSAVVPKTAPKSSTSHLKFLVDYVYEERLKCPPRLSCSWRQPLLEWPPRLLPRPPLLALDLPVSEAGVIIVSPPLIFAADEAVYVSGVIVADIYFWKMLNFHSYPCSLWEITPHVCSKRMRQWCW